MINRTVRDNCEGSQGNVTNAHRSLYSGVVISQPKNDNYNQYYISKVLEECSKNIDTSRKVNDKDACCPASAPKCG